MDIVDVEGAAFFERDVAAAGDLGETGEAGFDGEEERAVAIVLQFAWDESAGADEGDVAFPDVEELGEFVKRGNAEEVAELGDAGIVRELVAVFAVALDEFGLAHFGEGFFGGEAAVFGFHGTEFVDFDAAVVAGEADVGIDGGGMGVGEFLEQPDDGHGNGGEDEAEGAEYEVAEALDDTGGTDERGGANEDGGSVANEFEFAHLGGEHDGAGDEIIEQVTLEGLAIDVFGVTIVGLEDDVGAGFFEGFLERGILLAAKILGDEFGGGNHAGKGEAGFGEGGDVVGEGFGGLGAADDEGAESGFAGFHGEMADGADSHAEEIKEEEVGDDRVESEDASGKEIDVEAEAVGDDGHDTNDRDKEETAVLGPAVAA